VNQTLQNKSKTPSSKQGTRVCIPWTRATDKSHPLWNEICAWCVEQCGLPGDRFEWHPKIDYMEFYFKNEKDAIHFSLRWL
jgi:hypothetical protein